MLASLAMYQGGSTANDQLWQFIAQRLRAHGVTGVPDPLLHPRELHTHWLDPQLLLAQTCGYPLTHALAAQVQLLGVFHYDAPGCDGPLYRSHLVCRDADAGQPLAAFRGRTVAYNSEDSQSGYNSLRALVAPLAVDGRFFGKAVASGSHSASAELVRNGQADVAAIDCVSWAIFQRDTPQAMRGLRICGHTASVPGLPLITALQTPEAVVQVLRDVLHEVVQQPDLAGLRTALMVRGFSEIPLSAYEVIPQMAQAARDMGYSRI